jgi:RNA polymerase sigma-70 factor (ECF subfamily)
VLDEKVELKSPPQQPSRVEFEEFRVALAKLPSDQREALLLVGASGFSYEEAAAICESAVGTTKSRGIRASESQQRREAGTH